MNFSNRFFLYGPFLLFVALAAGVMVYWWFAAAALSQRLDALNGRDIAPGVRMSFASKRIVGFPFRLDSVFGNFTLQMQGAHGPIVWHADQFASHTLTYDRDVTIFEGAGRQELSWVGETGNRRSFAFTPGALRASIVENQDKFQRFDLDIISLAGTDFAAGRAQFHVRPDPAYDALDLVLDLQSVRFAGDMAAGFAKGLTHARIEGQLAPTAPFTHVFAAQTDWRRAFDTWRTEQGIFKVDEAAVSWAKCQGTSSGIIALDEAHRITGSLAFELADCDALPRQAATVTARPHAHRAVLSVLAALAARESADKSGALPVTIVFKDGLIFVGPGKALGLRSFFEPVGFLHPLY
jgi:hypothetical protein